MKDGWKTSEFWVTVMTVVVTFLHPLLSADKLQAVGHYTEQAAWWLSFTSMVAAAFVSAIYTLQRTSLKRSA